MAPEETYTHGHAEPVLRSHRWRTAANSARYLLEHLQPGASLLDVGCGPGTLTADLARLVAPGHVVGIDVAEDVVAEARTSVAAAGLPDVSCGSGTSGTPASLPGSFDVVHAHQVLQHLRDPSARWPPWPGSPGPAGGSSPCGRRLPGHGVVAGGRAARPLARRLPPGHRPQRGRRPPPAGSCSGGRPTPASGTCATRPPPGRSPRPTSGRGGPGCGPSASSGRPWPSRRSPTGWRRRPSSACSPTAGGTGRRRRPRTFTVSTASSPRLTTPPAPQRGACTSPLTRR
jgi:hypothetical protein